MPDCWTLPQRLKPFKESGLCQPPNLKNSCLALAHLQHKIRSCARRDPCHVKNRAITFALLLALGFLAADLSARETKRDKSDPMEAHRKRAMTANAETRMYAFLHNQKLGALAVEWDRTKTRSGRLRDYLAARDPAFKELTNRWKEPYSDEKLLSVLVYMAQQSALMRTFGGMSSSDEIIAGFDEHKKIFEELRAMLEEDRAKGVKSISKEKTDPAALDAIGISVERVASYREKMGAAKVTQISIKRVPEFYCGGHYVVWLPSPPEAKPDGSVRVVEQFDTEMNRQLLADAVYKDKHGDKPKSRSRLYKQIEGNWYLESERQAEL